ncbi:farnesyltranstransferase [Apilactobacillus ozensis DSM 23829 = JCM 17196]|uniref:Farnesyl diphosphate synthase n=1 Tax=Apilactobacillus ozensis DSM 23829 = JCM 17196 TaxID=1423781 RepID=A0A0R2AWN8_9LACO|nr:farnesyl diphosphate synthase [Apilactobacillus ozensis]KRM68070.1 farnesyltranstransferase [Apilactobacillus ozensis DSM 23829 = JCM 17196]
MFNSEVLKSFEQANIGKINNFLNQNISKYVSQQTLNDSMKYSLLAGGKRLRPMLTIATLQAFKVELNHDYLQVACAVELLHTYSLIHDDLPAMDNDDLRRNKPTNHRIFGPGMATLAGDGLLTLAFQWLADNDLSADKRIALVNSLSKAAGPSGMVAGQASDIEYEHQTLKLSQLENLHANKTGALIHYAVSAGLIIASDSEKLNNLLLSFADDFGLAFQIYDDILDRTATARAIGKPVDQDANKNTYPNLLGLKEATKKLKETILHGQKQLEIANSEYNLDTSILESFFSYFKI